MNLSILIVNYNVKDFLIDCIRSIYFFTPDETQFEIIVIDNNSCDGSIDAIEQKFPKILIIKNKENIGFSKAINQGSEVAKGKYLFFLNPDTKLVEDSISILFSFLEENKHIAILGPKLVNKDGKVQQSFWRKPTLINSILSIYHLDFLNKKKNYRNIDKSNYFNVDSVSGGAFFLKKKLFHDLNGFNEHLFWMEDIDFCIRALKVGHKIAYVPKTNLIHYIGKSSEKNWVGTISNRLLSKIKYFKIHHHPIEVFTLISAIYLLVIIKCMYLLILSLLNKVYREKLRGYFTTLKLLLLRQYQV